MLCLTQPAWRRSLRHPLIKLSHNLGVGQQQCVQQCNTAVAAAGFGLPNRRKRVFIVASLHGDARDVLLTQGAQVRLGSACSAGPARSAGSAGSRFCHARGTLPPRKATCSCFSILPSLDPKLTCAFWPPPSPRRAQKCPGSCMRLHGRRCYHCHARFIRESLEDHADVSYALDMGNAM